MIVEKAVGYILKNTTAITDVIGQRTYLLEAPQNTAFPFVTFSIAPSGVEPFDTKTTTQGGADLDRVRVEVHSFAASRDTAAILDSTIRSTLDRYPHGVVNGVTLDGVQYVTTSNFPEPNINDDGATIIFHYVSEYNFRVKY